MSTTANFLPLIIQLINSTSRKTSVQKKQFIVRIISTYTKLALLFFLSGLNLLKRTSLFMFFLFSLHSLTFSLLPLIVFFHHTQSFLSHLHKLFYPKRDDLACFTNFVILFVNLFSLTVKLHPVNIRRSFIPSSVSLLIFCSEIFLLFLLFSTSFFLLGLYRLLTKSWFKVYFGNL